MPGGTRICKVCGVEYKYCMTLRRDNAFRYQDVACCPEHGAEYFRQIAISRGEITDDAHTENSNAAADSDAYTDEESDDGEEEEDE